VDVDALFLEYDSGEPAAIVEYKDMRAKPADPRDPNYKALRMLADRYSPGPLVFLIVVYDPETWRMRVSYTNQAGRGLVGPLNQWMDESSWIDLLRRITGRPA
jgi:hypothetical protein